MDVGSSLKHVVASTMTLQHHSGSDLPQYPKIHPSPEQAEQCKDRPICPFTPYQGTKTLCIHPIWMLDPVRSMLYPKTPESTPHLHRPSSARIDPYVHSHHIKVPKHFVYIQYGCGIQCEACCILNHDITTSLGLGSTPNTPKSIPHLVDPCVHSHHI